MALASCFLVAVGLVIAAILLVPTSDPSPDTGIATSGGGYGTGSGDGFGAGEGSGSALEGAGTGAGARGTGKGTKGDDRDDAPKGQLSGAVAEATPPDGQSVVPGTNDTVVRITAAIAEEDDPLLPDPRGAVAGTRKGRAGEGAGGAGGSGGAGFLSLPDGPRSVAYVIDFSASMINGFDGRNRGSAVKSELVRSIQSLPADTRFTVILFGEQVPGDHSPARFAMPMPPAGTLVPATRENKLAATRWIGARNPSPGGTSNPWDAMEMALRIEPEAIFLLSDGAFHGNEQALHEVLARENADKRTKIHTVALGTEADVAGLELIAVNNGGTHRWVPLPPTN